MYQCVHGQRSPLGFRPRSTVLDLCDRVLEEKVEVTLNDDFQGGVDWEYISNGDGWSVGQDLLSSTTSLGSLATGGPVVEASYFSSNSDRDISAAIKALDTFGEVSVMSSPARA